VEALAFFAEDLLDPDERRTVSAHIDSCATCAATLDELAGVSSVLAAAPAPELPRDVADLLDRRIAEAARETAPASADDDTDTATGDRAPDASLASESGGLAPVTPIPRRRRGFGLTHLLVAAAAAVFVVGGGAAVLSGALQSSGDESGAAAPMEPMQDESLPDAAQSYRPAVLATGTVYTEAGLDDQAAAVLELSASADEDGGDVAEQSGEDAEQYGLEECAARLGESVGARVTLVDDAHYGSDSDPVWVLYAPEDDRVRVFVVDPRCVQDGDVTRSVLDETTVRVG
jgi:anti-sigma factor RsiW